MFGGVLVEKICFASEDFVRDFFFFGVILDFFFWLTLSRFSWGDIEPFNPSILHCRVGLRGWGGFIGLPMMPRSCINYYTTCFPIIVQVPDRALAKQRNNILLIVLGRVSSQITDASSRKKSVSAAAMTVSIVLFRRHSNSFKTFTKMGKNWKIKFYMHFRTTK